MKTMTTVERNEQDEHRALPKPDTLLAAPLILIAEEHPAIQELLNTALALAGYRTTICAGRHAALTWIDQLTSSGDCPALLLLDLSLPSIHAADFLSHLRTRWLDVCGGHPQIIVLTTSKQVQKDLAAQERVVLKPFHIQELLTLIQQMPFNHLQRITAPSQNKAIGDATKAVQGYERFVDNQASTRDQ